MLLSKAHTLFFAFFFSPQKKENMERIRSGLKAKIHVESDQLILYGSPTESAGCVLRGILELSLHEPTKVKSVSLRFTGKMLITWTERKSNCINE